MTDPTDETRPDETPEIPEEGNDEERSIGGWLAAGNVIWSKGNVRYVDRLSFSRCLSGDAFTGSEFDRLSVPTGQGTRRCGDGAKDVSIFIDGLQRDRSHLWN